MFVCYWISPSFLDKLQPYSHDHFGHEWMNFVNENMSMPIEESIESQILATFISTIFISNFCVTRHNNTVCASEIRMGIV